MVNSKTIATMKNIFKSLMLVAVAAMAFTSCQKVNEGIDSTPEAKHYVKFSAEFAETRTMFGDKVGDGYPSSWSGNESVAFSLNEAEFVASEVSVAGAKADFEVEFEADGKSEGVIYAFSPMGTYANSVSTAGFTGIKADSDDVDVWIPTEQTPLANSCDEGAHLIMAEYPYSGGVPASAHLQFAPVAAFGKMTIKGFNGNIKSVTLTASEDFVGNADYYYAGDKKGSMEAYSGSKELVLNATNVEDNVFWFGCIPVDLADGSLKVVITDDENKRYTKTISPNSDKPLAFVKGKVSKFSVNFEGIPSVDWVDNAYNLVTNIAHLAVGDKVVIVAADYDFALSTTQNNNNRGQVAVTKNGNNTIDFDSNVQILTLEKGTVDGTFAFYTGDGYLYAASNSSNHLKTQPTNDANGSWSIAINSTDGTKVVAQGTNTRNTLQYNQDSSLFSCYGANSTQKLICIYKLVGEYTPEVPAIPAIVYSIDDVSITADATSGEATVVATNADGWNITAEADVEWITDLQYATGKITFSSEANEGEAREAKVTVTAVKEGYDNVEETFTITQDAKPTEGETLKGWLLVTNASDLAVGDEIIIAAKDYNYALSTTQNNNNRGQAAITKSGDTLVAPSASVQILTLQKGNVDGTFGFYTGSGYLYAASSGSNYLKTQNTNNANGSWKVSIAADGTATIKAQGSYTRNVMQYNQSSSLFACYGSANQKALVVYKYYDGGESGGGESETPAVPSFSLDVDALEFGAEGGEKTITVTRTNTDAPVEAESDNSMFTVNVDGDKVTVTAAANELEEPVIGNITIKVGDLEATVVKATLAAKPTSSGGVEGEKTYTLQFGASYNSKGQSSYSNSWYATCGGFIWDIVNANNNNNGWSYVKMGSKNAAYVGKITTRKAMPETIKTVTMTVDAVTVNSINSIKLVVASDSSFSNNVQTISVTPATGDLKFNIPTPFLSFVKPFFSSKQRHNSSSMFLALILILPLL